MSQHINICWDFFLSILFEFPSCNNLLKLSNSFLIQHLSFFDRMKEMKMSHV